MDIEKAAHAIAVITAERYVDANLPGYKLEPHLLATDAAKTYKFAYNQALETLK